MTLRTSLVIAGDASGAVAAMDAAQAGMAGASAEAKRLSDAYAAADKTIDRLASAQVAAKAETLAAKAAFDAGEISIKEYNTRLIETKAALSLVETQHRAAITGIRQMSAANDQIGPSLAQARAGYTNLSRQIQDVGVMASQPGVSIGTIITLQAGQVADAVSQMGGKFAGFATFMAGPYGTAIILVVGIIATLVQKHIEAGNAADQLKNKQLSLADALRKTSIATDEAIKALDDYNEAQGKARDNTDAMIKLNLASAEARLKDALATREQLKAQLEKEKIANIGGGVPGYAGFSVGGRTLGLAGAINDNDKGLKSLEQTTRNLRIQNAARNAEAAADPIKAINNKYDDMAEAAKRAAAGNNALAISLEGTLTKIQKQRKVELDAERASGKKGPADKSAQLAEVGEDTASRIANIHDQFSDLPSAIEKANKALRQLDDIASDIEQRKPKNLIDLRTAIEGARGAIEQSLTRPFNDYLEKSREAVEIDKLLIAGRDQEAAVLRVVLSLKDKMRPLDQAQLAAVVEIIAAEQRRALVLRDQRALIQSNIRAVQDMRSALEGTVADMLRGKFSVERIISSIGNSYINLTAQRLVEQMFGDSLRAMEEQARGGGKIDAAATSMASAMGKGSDAVINFASTIERAIARIDSTVSGQAVANDNGAANDNADDVIVVTGKRVAKNAGENPSSLLLDMADKLLRDIGIKIPQGVTGGIKSVLGKLEKGLPSVLAGAFTGSTASRIVLGDRGTGGQIGGAIGGAVGQKIGEKVLGGVLSKVASSLGSAAGPIGAIIGGLAGTLLGSLFNKAKTGGAAIGIGANGNAGVTGSGGNNATLKGQTNTIGGNISQALNTIAERLTASIGDFSVAIGQRNDYYRVSASGSVANATAKHPGSDVIYDGQDLAQATTIALANAIGDGAIKGISARVSRALTSSTDIDQALREAGKVQDLETSLGGVTGKLQQEFRQFESQAAERLRLARAYGFEVVKVEEFNAKERLALSKRLASEQTGSLQSLIDEITSGSLFEGSAVDQRKLLLDEVAKLRTDAEAGVEGSADKLAQKLQQLNTVSKAAYGTTGGFATDQSTILDAARDTIAKVNRRVADAQKTSDPALATTNQLLDENADQLAKISTAATETAEYLRQLAANGNANQADYWALAQQAGYR